MQLDLLKSASAKSIINILKISLRSEKFSSKVKSRVNEIKKCGMIKKVRAKTKKSQSKRLKSPWYSKSWSRKVRVKSLNFYQEKVGSWSWFFVKKREVNREKFRWDRKIKASILKEWGVVERKKLRHENKNQSPRLISVTWLKNCSRDLKNLDLDR